MTDEQLTPDEIAALTALGWESDGSFTGNTTLYLRFHSRGVVRVQTAQEWRAELPRQEAAREDSAQETP